MFSRQRQQEALANAARLVTQAGALTRESVRLRATADRLRAERSRWRAPMETGRFAGPTDAWFTVRGIVDGLPLVARWRPGSLDCDPELARRASIVVALDETFTAPSATGAIVHASLESPPIAVLLTVMRAFSSVQAVDLSLDMLHPPLQVPTE